MALAQFAVKLYIGTEIIIGYIRRPQEERLLDILNGILAGQSEDSSGFLEVIDMTISHPDGRKEKLPVVYFNKLTIQLAALSDGDTARGIGGKVGYRYPPFIQKSPVAVRLYMPTYVLIGSMHCARGQRIRNVLQEKAMFLPVTNARIRAAANGTWWGAPLVAANRKQVLSLQEEDSSIPPNSTLS